MERLIVNSNRIQVPRKFKDKKPKLYKIMGMEAYYKKYGHFYGQIVVNKKLKIIDGYVAYYVGKNVLKKKTLPITILSFWDRIKAFFRREVK